VTLEITTNLSGGVISANDFWPAFALVGILSALSAIVFVLLPRDAGDEMSGRRLVPDPVTVMRERS